MLLILAVPAANSFLTHAGAGWDGQRSLERLAGAGLGQRRMGAKARPPPAHTRPVTHNQTPSCLRRFTCSLYCPCCDALSLHMTRGDGGRAPAGPPAVPARTERLGWAAGSGEATAPRHVAPAARELCRSDLPSWSTSICCVALSSSVTQQLRSVRNGSLSTHREIARSLSSHPRTE